MKNINKKMNSNCVLTLTGYDYLAVNESAASQILGEFLLEFLKGSAVRHGKSGMYIVFV